MATRMQQRRGTAAQWATANPVLADGEVGYETDSKVVKIGDGAQTWNQLTPILTGQFLGVNAKAVDADRLDGLDSTAFAQKQYIDDLVLPAGINRALINHFGSTTIFPTTGVKLGDRVWRSDVLCEMYYNGGAWRQVMAARGTAAQRVAVASTNTALYQGFQWYDTDTGNLMEWQNSFIGWTRPWALAWNEIAAAPLAIGQAITGTYVEYGSVIVPIPKGRKIRIQGKSSWYTAATNEVRLTVQTVIYRDANANPSTVASTGGEVGTAIGGPAIDIAAPVLDTPYTTAGTYAGSANTKFVVRAYSAGALPNASLYTIGNGTEDSYIKIVDVGPATPPPTS